MYYIEKIHFVFKLLKNIYFYNEIKYDLFMSHRKRYTFIQKLGRCIRYNLSAFFSLIFSPYKFSLFSWWEIFGIILFFAVTITMLILSS